MIEANGIGWDDMGWYEDDKVLKFGTDEANFISIKCECGSDNGSGGAH